MKPNLRFPFIVVQLPVFNNQLGNSRLYSTSTPTDSSLAQMNPEILNKASHVLSAIRTTIQKLLPKKLFQPITTGETSEMSQSEFLAITFNLLLVYHPFFSSNHNYLHNNFSSSYTSSNDTVIRILTPNNYNVKVRLIIFSIYQISG